MSVWILARGLLIIIITVMPDNTSQFMLISAGICRKTFLQSIGSNAVYDFPTTAFKWNLLGYVEEEELCITVMPRKSQIPSAGR